MSKHSKWAKIKRQKSVTDTRRGQTFTKLSRAIAVAAREGGADPETNVRLRMAVDRALAENMTKENIQRTIDRAVGTGEGAAMESLVAEGYGPGGAALLIEAITDNRNRTVGSIRQLLSDAGGALGDAGSTQWMFERRGRILLENPLDTETAELAAIDAGAVDTARDGNALEVLTPLETVRTIADVLRGKGYTVTAADVVLVPKNPLRVLGSDADRLHALLERLEEHDDVVDVTTNAVPAVP